MNTKILPRTERVRLFLSEYYFGYAWYITVNRMIGGPLITAFGLLLLNKPASNQAIAGVGITYGIYYIFKPYLWVLFRWQQFKTVEISLTIEDGKMTIYEKAVRSTVDLSKVKISKRKDYYTFALTKTQKICLPFRVFTPAQSEHIESFYNVSSYKTP